MRASRSRSPRVSATAIAPIGQRRGLQLLLGERSSKTVCPFRPAEPQLGDLLEAIATVMRAAMRRHGSEAASVVFEPFSFFLVEDSRPRFSASVGRLLGAVRYLPNPGRFRSAIDHYPDFRNVDEGPRLLDSEDCQRARRILTRSLAEGVEVSVAMHDAEDGSQVSSERARLSFLLAPGADPLAGEDGTSESESASESPPSSLVLSAKRRGVGVRS